MKTRRRDDRVRDPKTKRVSRATPDTEMIYGLHSALAVFAQRPTEIRRIGYAREIRGAIDEMLTWARSNDVPCREMQPRELDSIAASKHHEGLVLAATPRRWVRPADLAGLMVARNGAAVALDRVRNPHNIGAILRSAAFFGADALLLGSPAPHPGLAPSAVRVAQGGAEHVLVSRTTDLANTLRRLREHGVSVVGTDRRAAASHGEHDFSRPAILVLGNEREGLSDRIRAECNATVAIRGSGEIDSLNVAVAAGVLLARVAQAL